MTENMTKVFTIIGVVAAILVTYVLESAIIMWLWNYVIVALFAVAPITFGIAIVIWLIINFAIALFRNLLEFDS